MNVSYGKCIKLYFSYTGVSETDSYKKETRWYLKKENLPKTTILIELIIEHSPSEM